MVPWMVKTGVGRPSSQPPRLKGSEWAKWLPHPCRIGDPHRCRAGGKIGSGPQVGKLATSPLPYRGAPPLQSGGQNQKWPTSGQIGYLTPAVSGSPTAAEQGVKSEVAHKWANWLRQPCRIGEPHHLKAGGKIRSGPEVGEMDASPLPYRGAPPLQSGWQNQKWHALLGAVEDEVTSPNASPVRLQKNTELLSICGLTGTPQRVSLLGLGGKECSFLAHANCTPFFSPKHLDFVTEKNSFFCHLENTTFQTLPKKCIFHQFCPLFCCF